MLHKVDVTPTHRADVLGPASICHVPPAVLWGLTTIVRKRLNPYICKRRGDSRRLYFCYRKPTLPDPRQLTQDTEPVRYGHKTSVLS